MIRRPPRSTRTDTLFPYTALFRSIRRRFLHAMSELPAPMAQRLCRIDPTLETAYVLMDESEHPAEMRGVGRIYVDEASDSAEFSVLVEQDWSRRGLGADRKSTRLNSSH